MSLIVLIGLIVAIVYLVRRDRRTLPRQGGPYYVPPYRSGRTDEALEILQRRYAAGEIGKDEYEQKLRDLM